MCSMLVSIDLTSKTGVVKGGIYGIPTAPLLVDGAKDFAVALIGVTGLAGDILPGTALEGWLS